MKISFLKIRQLFVLLFVLFILPEISFGQYKDFQLSPNGDTLNATDLKGLKQGKWVNSIPEIRGEPGYEEEGYFKDNEKTGPWRKYNLNGDLIAMENYKKGGKHGIQQYYSFLGHIQREEEWKGYDPDSPFDTIPIYGQNNNEIVEYRLVKANQYSVPHGEWRFYDANGRVINVERYDRGQLVKDAVAKTVIAPTADKPKEKVKTKEILEYEKKYSKKQRAHMERDGKTGL
jgi:hypothetical protein